MRLAGGEGWPTPVCGLRPRVTTRSVDSKPLPASVARSPTLLVLVARLHRGGAVPDWCCDGERPGGVCLLVS